MGGVTAILVGPHTQHTHDARSSTSWRAHKLLLARARTPAGMCLAAGARAPSATPAFADCGFATKHTHHLTEQEWAAQPSALHGRPSR